MIGKTRLKLKKTSLSYLVMTVLAILLVVSIVLPVPYFIEVPGSAENVAKFIAIPGKEDRDEGAYLLTTVGIRQGTPASVLLAQLSPFQEVVSKTQLMGDSSNKEYDRLTAYQMRTSGDLAKKVALDLVKQPAKLTFEGVYVMGLTPTSDFKDKLTLGDVVTKVNGNDFHSSQEFMTYIKQQPVGSQVQIDFLREGKPQQTSGKLTLGDQDKKAAIGISLVDQTILDSPIPITIDGGNIGGPSAGLMFTLGTYQLLSGEELRHGRQIAGTGTIDITGKVGSIGGIDKKVLAAAEAGADIFFAPAEELSPEVKKKYPDLQSNWELAKATGKKIKTSMTIVPVETVQEAIDYLKGKDKD